MSTIILEHVLGKKYYHWGRPPNPQDADPANWLMAADMYEEGHREGHCPLALRRMKNAVFTGEVVCVCDKRAKELRMLAKLYPHFRRAYAERTGPPDEWVVDLGPIRIRFLRRRQDPRPGFGETLALIEPKPKFTKGLQHMFRCGKHVIPVETVACRQALFVIRTHWDRLFET